eukprot:CAMPEP_0115209730 /NCGR_PEP_ID=MMETSP0270-20121206/21884_1 /TAXON_ID=71861 /ORGANISM="Scrippsiella trochoidea, Strain CCMP3099" /LENGTH=957 /DNA_ID=CAMNT_0002623367 /DNA_START=69 /DNA_END=2942 /DNA_ORIENTATION=-
MTTSMALPVCGGDALLEAQPLAVESNQRIDLIEQVGLTQPAERQEEGLPAPSGPMYKCSFCQELVYESQLDYHAQVCVDPADKDPTQQDDNLVTAPADKAAGVVANTLLESLPVAGVLVGELPRDDAGRTCNFSEDCHSKSLSGTGNSLKAWKDSMAARHQSAQSERALARRSKLVEEMQQKEVQECTFQPKILPRSAMRPGSPPLEHQQYARSQKLKQVEVQAYAELTLRPKISPFAQRLNETSAQGSGSVFDRLYEAAQEFAARKLAMAAPHSAELNCKASSGPFTQSLGSVRRSSPRSIPTSDLLYSDALDRRERQKLMTEQLKEEEESTRDKHQVLERSRRYYWHMLERQIKVAFDLAADGDGAEGCLLTVSQLEDFLIHFGCLRPRRIGSESDPMAAADFDEENARVCAALWRHLDPEGTGHTDLFTLTVFFHILMGAVDETALAGGAGSGSVATAGVAAAGVEGDAIPDVAEPVTAATAPLKMPPEDAASGAQPGILELFQRWDPHRIRAEFQNLYIQRMYLQRQQQEKHNGEGTELQPTAPEMNLQSRVLAAKVIEREKDAAAGERPIQTHADLLMWRHTQVEAKKEERRTQAKKNEVSGCTFRPKTSPRPKDLQAQIATPSGATRSEVLYARAVADRERQEARAELDRSERSRAEVRDCTFRPNTARSERSFQRVHQPEVFKDTVSTSKPMPRGFHEARERLRAAGESQRLQRQMQEDRLARVEAVGTAATTASSARSPRAAVEGGARSTNPKRASTTCSSGKEKLANSARGRQFAQTVPMSRVHGSVSPTRKESRGRGPMPVSARGARPSSQQPARSTVPAEREMPSGSTSARAQARPPATSTPSQSSPASAAPTHTSMTTQGVEVDQSCDETSMGFHGTDTLTPILHVDVNIAPGEPLQRLSLYDGQSVHEAATEFADKHGLAPGMVQRLQSMLEELVQRQQKSRSQ